MNKEDYKNKWQYSEDERPKGCCYDCRMKYDQFPDMIIPDVLWELINPTKIEGAGLLCPTCIANRLDFLGIWYDLQNKLCKLPCKRKHKKRDWRIRPILEVIEIKQW